MRLLKESIMLDAIERLADGRDEDECGVVVVANQQGT